MLVIDGRSMDFDGRAATERNASWSHDMLQIFRLLYVLNVIHKHQFATKSDTSNLKMYSMFWSRETNVKNVNFSAQSKL